VNREESGQGRTYSILLRVYTPKVEEVEDRVERAVASIRQIIATKDKFPALRQVIVLIPDDYDCGETYQALFNRVAIEGLLGLVEVYAPAGHHSCEVLNQGVFESKTSHVLIVSGKAMSYLTPSSMVAIDQVFANGAKVAGLAVDELTDMILAGLIQNTFGAWDIDALIDIGGFDSKNGVEEMSPLIRLAHRYGKCIAPIRIDGGTLDVLMSETAKKRHQEVMVTKTERQLFECRRLDSNFEFIQSAVM
jgi:hypothetical protein